MPYLPLFSLDPASPALPHPPQFIPNTLAVTAAKDASELVAKLRAYHYTAQTDPSKKQLAQVGWLVGRQ